MDGVHLDTVDTCLLEQTRRLGERLDDLVDLGLGDLTRRHLVRPAVGRGARRGADALEVHDGLGSGAQDRVRVERSMSGLMVNDRPKPAVSCTNSLAPVAWNTGIHTARSRYIFLFLCNHWPNIGLYTGWHPGSTRPASCLATSRRNSAPARSKWFFSIQPNRSVPPIDVMTMRFLIAREPMVQGSKRGARVSFTGAPYSL